MGVVFVVYVIAIGMMDRWKDWNVDERRQFMEGRGVEYGKRNKDELLELCTLAVETNIELDPDGVRDDIRSVIKSSKLPLDDGDSLPLPSTSEGAGDISFVPAITEEIKLNLLCVTSYRPNWKWKTLSS